MLLFPLNQTMKFLNLLIVTGLLGTVWFSGCAKSLPKDFPKVYPITVTVTDGATPLADVKVSFLFLGQGSFAVSAVTNASGIATPMTAVGAHTATGIPAGEYVVTLQDLEKIDLGVSPEEIAKMSRSEQGELEKKRQELLKALVKKVPKVLCQTGKVTDRSPLRYTVIEGKNELPIDVAEYK